MKQSTLLCVFGSVGVEAVLGVGVEKATSLTILDFFFGGGFLLSSVLFVGFGRMGDWGWWWFWGGLGGEGGRVV